MGGAPSKDYVVVKTPIQQSQQQPQQPPPPHQQELYNYNPNGNNTNPPASNPGMNPQAQTTQGTTGGLAAPHTPSASMQPGQQTGYVQHPGSVAPPNSPATQPTEFTHPQHVVYEQPQQPPTIVYAQPPRETVIVDRRRRRGPTWNLGYWGTLDEDCDRYDGSYLHPYSGYGYSGVHGSRYGFSRSSHDRFPRYSTGPSLSLRF